MSCSTALHGDCLHYPIVQYTVWIYHRNENNSCYVSTFSPYFLFLFCVWQPGTIAAEQKCAACGIGGPFLCSGSTKWGLILALLWGVCRLGYLKYMIGGVSQALIYCSITHCVIMVWYPFLVPIFFSFVFWVGVVKWVGRETVTCQKTENERKSKLSLRRLI